MSPPQHPMVDPRLLPPGAPVEQHYPRQGQPAPYPPAGAPPSSGAIKMYSEQRVAEQSHPYYTLPGRRSPSEDVDVADTVESDRRESAGADMMNQR